MKLNKFIFMNGGKSIEMYVIITHDFDKNDIYDILRSDYQVFDRGIVESISLLRSVMIEI